MLSKTADELLVTEIPQNVYDGLAASPVEEVHVFARRGPAQAKFTPLELRELDHSPNVEVLVDPRDIEYDDGSVEAINSDNQTKLVVRELERYAMRTVRGPGRSAAAQAVAALLRVAGRGAGDGRVEGLRTERTELTGDGNVRGTGEFKDWPVQAIYRCVGYRSSELPGPALGQPQPRRAARRSAGCSTWTATTSPGIYVNGWVKRGPVGLIGHTKGDAIETVRSLLEDLPDGPAGR